MSAIVALLITLNLFIGGVIPNSFEIKTPDAEIKTYGDNFFYATVNDDDTYTKIGESGGELVKGTRYAIIINYISGNNYLAIKGYENSTLFEVMSLTNEGNIYSYAEDGTDGSEKYYVREFYPSYLVKTESVDNISLYAGEDLTEEFEIKLDMEYGDPITVSSTEDNFQCYYLDADAYDAGNTIRVDELVEGRRYYVALEIPHVKDTDEYNLFGSEDGTLVKADDFVVTINGVTAYPFEEHTNEANSDSSNIAMYYIEFIANEKTKQTDLIYTIPESYTWTITNSFNQDVNGGFILVDKDIDADGITQINVNVSNIDLEKGNQLIVTVDSTNEWNMVNEKDDTKSSPYKVYVGEVNTTEDGKEHLTPTEAYWDDKPIIKCSASESDASARGIFTWDDKPTKAGTYKDTLTFTAEIKGKDLPKVGTTISFDAYGDSTLENFRVTRVIDGNTCELIERKALDNALALYNKELDPDTPGDADKIGKFDIDPGDPDEYKTYSKYFGSNVDNYLNNDYLNGLKSNVANAIKSVMVSQDLYTVSTETAKINEATLRDSLQSENRKIYVLGFSQLKDYLSSVSSLDARSSIRELYNLQPNSNTKVLISSVSDSVTYYGCNGTTVYDNSNGTFAFMYRYNSNPIAVYPTFQIDLSNIDFEIVDETTSR